MRGLLKRLWYTHRFKLLAMAAALLACMCYHKILYLCMEPFAALMIAMLPIVALNDDAVSHFDRWHLILPLKRQRYADAYYLFTAMLTLLLLSVHTVIWFQVGLEEGWAVVAGVLTVLCLLAPAVYLPVSFRFGIAAGRLTAIGMILPYVLLIVSVIDLWGLLVVPPQELTAFLTAGLLPVAAPVLLFAVSRNLSARALQTKKY